jgi:hydrogenase/urease accessory protein HupE
MDSSKVILVTLWLDDKVVGEQGAAVLACAVELTKELTTKQDATIAELAIIFMLGFSFTTSTLHSESYLAVKRR